MFCIIVDQPRRTYIICLFPCIFGFYTVCSVLCTRFLCSPSFFCIILIFCMLFLVLPFGVIKIDWKRLIVLMRYYHIIWIFITCAVTDGTVTVRSTSSGVVQRLVWRRSRVMPTSLLLMMMLVWLWRQDAAPATVTSCSTAAECCQPHLISYVVT